MVFRFLHLADTHLETHFGGRPATRERLRLATHEAFARAISFAIDRRLDAVLVAGDLYDDPLLSPRTEFELVRQVRRLEGAKISFLWCAGNHDPAGPAHRCGDLGLKGLPGVHVFQKRAPEAVVVKNAAGEPVGVVIGAGHPTDREGSNLAAAFTPQLTDLPVVGLLHTQVESARSAAQHARYAPSTPADFERQQYSYWALGHVHLRQQAVPGAPAYYAGNLQGRNPSETGAKGGYLVDAEAGVPAEPEFVAFAPVRWESLRIDTLEPCTTWAELAGELVRAIGELAASTTEELVVRLQLSGPSPLAAALRDPAHRTELEDELGERAGLLECQVRDAGLHAPWDRAELRRTPSVLAEALSLLDVALEDGPTLDALAPKRLAGLSIGATSEDARRVYLRELSANLEHELLARALREPSVGDEQP